MFMDFEIYLPSSLPRKGPEKSHVFVDVHAKPNVSEKNIRDVGSKLDMSFNDVTSAWNDKK